MKKLLIFALLLGAVCFIQPVHAQNYSFNKDLTLGSVGADVSALQDFLIQNGFTIPSIANGAVPKGYFGAQTRAAVVAFQTSRGVPGTGYVGPMTRGKLNGGAINPQSFTVLYPNGGESLQYGTNHVIRWTPADLTSSAGVTLTLVQNLSGCFNAGTRPCLAIVDPEYVIASNIANTGSYSWALTPSVPSVSQPLIGDNYYIRVCRGSSTANSGNCDTSNTTFKIVSMGVVASKPVINGIDAPTTLGLNQTGTWTVRATDANNQALSYSVDWGVAYNCGPLYPCGAEAVAPSAPQTSTFTHSYSSAGVYTVTFTVTNASGQSAQTSATVTVTDVGTTPSSLKVLSPGARDVLVKNTPFVIRWSSPAYFRATYANIRLIPQNICPSGYSCLPIAPYVIATNIPANQNSYTWNVGSVKQSIPATDSSSIVPLPSTSIAPNGEYLIQICETDTSNCANSGTFTIADTNSNLPDITIISPNGGESWSVDVLRNVTLQFTGDSSKIGNLVTLALVDSSNQSFSLGEFPVNGVGTQTYQVSATAGVPNRAYRIYAELYSTGVTCMAIGCPPAPRTLQAYDYSDNSFTINNCPIGYLCTPFRSY